MAPSLPDPLNLPWPRGGARGLIRPIEAADVEAVWAYRRLPEVVRYLNHGILTRREVQDRFAERLAVPPADATALTRGVAFVVDSQLAGDAMLRVVSARTTEHQLWIGYALHPGFWGKGLGTELATLLVECGRALGLPVWADTLAGNVASQRVLEKAGMHRHFEDVVDGRRTLYTAPSAA